MFVDDDGFSSNRALIALGSVYYRMSLPGIIFLALSMALGSRELWGGCVQISPIRFRNPSTPFVDDGCDVDDDHVPLIIRAIRERRGSFCSLSVFTNL